MQNKFLYQMICLSGLLLPLALQAQETDDFLLPEVGSVDQEVDNTPDLTDKQAVDFPARTSLDSLELAPLPGIYETDITGPLPLAASVSAKDMPSERLIGMLTPEVFKEMAELERDNTFLKLQIQKETMKNDLEKLRARYRQDRLDEIAKREDVVRTRIQWWQEQEKIRQDLEKQRAALETAKIEQGIAPTTVVTVSSESDADASEEVIISDGAPKNYEIVDITGTRGMLNARLKNVESGRISIVRIGDELTDGSRVESISATQVILSKDGEKIAIVFDDV